MNNRQRKWIKTHYYDFKLPHWWNKEQRRLWRVYYVKNPIFGWLLKNTFCRETYLINFKNDKPKYRKLRNKHEIH